MDSFSLISDSAYVAQVRVLLSSHFFSLFTFKDSKNYSDYTYDMLPNYYFILELVLFNLYIFYAIYLLDQEWGWNLVLVWLFNIAIVFILEFKNISFCFR